MGKRVLLSNSLLLGEEGQESVSQTASFTSVVARRYAGSLYDLAAAGNCVDTVEKELRSFMALLESNDDLERLVKSPVFGAKDQLAAISAFADKAGLKGKGAAELVKNFFCVVAQNRRLFLLPDIVRCFYHLASEGRGEIPAEVVSAEKLSASQEKELKSVLKGVAGKDVHLHMSVDPSLIGGLVVRLGSRQIDTSIKTKLSSLKLLLKEVG